MFKEIFNKLLGSLDNKNDSGFSARKLTSLMTMVLITLTHIIWLKHAFINDDFKYLTEVLIIDELFVLTLLGIITLEQIARLKNNGNNKTEK